MIRKTKYQRAYRLSENQDAMNRNVTIIENPSGKKVVLINGICFKGKNRNDWKNVETYLKKYVGKSPN